MAYIYKITNDINDKVYVGKTEFSLEKRFREHCQDAIRRELEQRPLYSAMRKYGCDKFHISLIEETDNPNDREVFWIQELNSYEMGYNATTGGDGKKYLDYEEIISMYQETQNCCEVARRLNVSPDSVRKILHANGIELKTSEDISRDNNTKHIEMINRKTKEVVQIFATYAEAARYVYQHNLSSSKNIKGIAVHISGVCKGKRKTAYEHLWVEKN